MAVSCQLPVALLRSNILLPPDTPFAQRGCPNCGGHAFEFDPARGDSVCLECGCVTEENTIVAEVGFTETSSGAAAVQGTFIGNNQGASKSHPDSSGP